ncbi:MAG TPA: hypothetical protein PLV68_15040 [Ilumatobacteraceae bacterium]|nr:hypothetical protein [Ilumatobacteraceae bacterium]
MNAGRWIARGVVAGVACVIPAITTSGCAECEAKCAGSHVEIAVGGDVAQVTACDAAGRCSKQSFGPPGAAVIDRSFTVQVTDTGKRLTLTLSGVSVTGAPIPETVVQARASKGDCGCPGPAKMYITASAAGPFGD